MSGAAWLTAVSAVAVMFLGLALVATRRRLIGAEARGYELERRVEQLAAVAAEARRDARAATLTAQRAAASAGLDDDLPRLAFEPVTAPIVRAVAFGAGARQALARVVRRSA